MVILEGRAAKGCSRSRCNHWPRSAEYFIPFLTQGSSSPPPVLSAWQRPLSDTPSRATRGCPRRPWKSPAARTTCCPPEPHTTAHAWSPCCGSYLHRRPDNHPNTRARECRLPRISSSFPAPPAASEALLLLLLGKMQKE